jgi:hypothetical protein
MLSLTISCPHCFEVQTLAIAPDDLGHMDFDYGVCCRSMSLHIWIDEDGCIQASVQQSW